MSVPPIPPGAEHIAGWHGSHVGAGWHGEGLGTAASQVNPKTGRVKVGWSTKLTARKRFKKWAKGKTKAQIKRAKKDIKRVRKQHESARHRAKRLEHNRELRRTRPERMAKADLKRRSDAAMKNHYEAEYIMPCKWCKKPFDRRTWKHVDGKPCPGPQ